MVTFLQNGNIQLLFIRIEQSVQIQALSASSTMNKSIIRFLTLLVMKTEIRQIGPYFHPTMIICKVFLLITKTVQNHTKLEHTTRLKGRDRDRQGGRDLRGGGLLHELEKVGGGLHRLRYLLCHRRFSSPAAAGRHRHPRHGSSSQSHDGRAV